MKARIHSSNAKGASLVEYAMLVNIFGLFLLVVTAEINQGVHTAFSPLGTALHFHLGGGTTTDMTREQGGDPLRQCRRGLLAPTHPLCVEDDN